VTKRFDDVTAVDDISLEVEAGRFLTLLGPSGSGKTTLLMMMAGFVQPTAGSIFAGAHDITHVPPERREFGMVFQGYALFPNMTVAQNIAFALKIRKWDKAAVSREVERMLDTVRLTALGGRLPRELSGGQQQRVALARALIFKPKVLLLDEPLSALDKKLRAGLQEELRDLHQRLGTTFIFVTHDQDEALSMSDEIVIINRGRIVQRGSPKDLYDRPASHFVADFLGRSTYRWLIAAIEKETLVCSVGRHQAGRRTRHRDRRCRRQGTDRLASESWNCPAASPPVRQSPAREVTKTTTRGRLPCTRGHRHRAMQVVVPTSPHRAGAGVAGLALLGARRFSRVA
jgi:ABC-type Fe3+/spermidine/putrescine transport system ATPase subunit